MFESKKGNTGKGSAKRKAMPKKQSQAEFTATAMKKHPKNFAASPMRGGIRL